ncbi:Proteophosphoglycan 5 [Rhodotorula toruloides ATCC 204091]|nr:Proteophosphoglycan 5 [Rhodotorula toruloides ATCC 204091]
MRLSALSSVLFLLPSLASATYFTNPTTSTVWADAGGQPITWHYQPGGAPRGDLVLSAVGGSGMNPKNSNSLTIAQNVDLTSESLTFPSGTALRSNSRQYILAIVNSANPTDVYTQIGPFEIDGFGAASSPSSPSSSNGSGGAVGNGSGQDATATNPPVSSASPTSSATLTSTLLPSTSANSNISIVTVTASGSVGAASQGARPSSAAGRGARGGLAVVAVAAACSSRQVAERATGPSPQDQKGGGVGARGEAPQQQKHHSSAQNEPGNSLASLLPSGESASDTLHITRPQQKQKGQPAPPSFSPASLASSTTSPTRQKAVTSSDRFELSTS